MKELTKEQVGEMMVEATMAKKEEVYEAQHQEVLQKLLILKVKRNAIEEKKEELAKAIKDVTLPQPDKIKEAIKDLEAKEGEVIKTLLTEEAEIAVAIKNLIMELQITVALEDKSAMAIYKNGAWKWNNDKLEGMAILQPGILQARTQGKSSVIIKMNK